MSYHEVTDLALEVLELSGQACRYGVTDPRDARDRINHWTRLVRDGADSATWAEEKQEILDFMKRET